MIDDEYYRIAAVEHEHWWYRSLHHLVLSNINKHFDDKAIHIIDAGCGTGGLMTFLRKHGYKNIKGFDISATAVQICNDKNLDVFKGDLKDISKYFNDHDADVIISNDTFYFLDADQQRNVTDAMNRLLRKNGLVITNMPSLKAFSGIHDLQVGIKDRFRKKDIWQVFDRNKYSLLTEIYWPLVLSPFIWASRYKQRLKMKFNKHTKIESDLRNEGRLINRFLFFITKTENNILNKKPFGSSLFLVVKKNNRDHE